MADPVQLRPNEAKLYMEIKKDPDRPIEQIAKAIGLSRMSISLYLRGLIETEMIEIVSRNRKSGYRYRALSKPYEVENRTRTPVIVDPFVMKALNTQLTNEQLAYLKENKKKFPRSVLAKELGLSKLELNLVLEKLGRK